MKASTSTPEKKLASADRARPKRDTREMKELDGKKIIPLEKLLKEEKLQNTVSKTPRDGATAKKSSPGIKKTDGLKPPPSKASKSSDSHARDHKNESPVEEEPLPNGETVPNDSIALYLNEVSKVPLLSHEDEIALAERIEAGKIARARLAESSLSKKDQVELLRVVEDGWAAREHLVTANFRLVISVAKKYVGRGVPFLDLIQEGNIGLIRATKKFDYTRGHRFSTYATWWIRQAVSRAVADQGRTIRIPVHMGDQINRLRRSIHKLTQELGRDPSSEELAKAQKTTAKKIEELIKISQRPLSLELPTDDEEDQSLGDYTPDTIHPPPTDMVDEKIMREHLYQILETLPAREVRILQLRYGLQDGKIHTLGDIGRKLGVTRERVRQIEAQALRRLRQPRIRRELQEYLRN
jgi:RNA polymerase primary sigma factor